MSATTGTKMCKQAYVAAPPPPPNMAIYHPWKMIPYILGHDSNNMTDLKLNVSAQLSSLPLLYVAENQGGGAWKRRDRQGMGEP